MIATRYHTSVQKKEGIANGGVHTTDFGLNDAEIKKMTKYQGINYEVKRSWKLKNAKVVPVMVGAMGMTTKNLTEILKFIPGNITTNELQLEAVRGSVTILLLAQNLRTKKNFTAWSRNRDPLPK